MVNTSHGHHVPGTPFEAFGGVVADGCGGVHTCDDCIRESAHIYHAIIKKQQNVGLTTGIETIVVTDNRGVEHRFEGVDGYVRIQNTNDGKGLKPTEWKTVSAHMKLKE